MERFRGGLVCEAHRRLYHSTLGSRVIKKRTLRPASRLWVERLSVRGYGLAFAFASLRVCVEVFGVWVRGLIV